ncbi:MAG: aldo/keto reductase [Streptosporangiaceae bacterium]
MTGQDVSAAYIRQACQESLRRLGTDRIDLYQLRRAASESVAEGLVRSPRAATGMRGRALRDGLGGSARSGPR